MREALIKIDNQNKKKKNLNRVSPFIIQKSKLESTKKKSWYYIQERIYNITYNHYGVIFITFLTLIFWLPRIMSRDGSRSSLGWFFD